MPNFTDFTEATEAEVEAEIKRLGLTCEWDERDDIENWYDASGVLVGSWRAWWAADGLRELLTYWAEAEAS